jgi:hypothetical protein
MSSLTAIDALSDEVRVLWAAVRGFVIPKFLAACDGVTSRTGGEADRQVETPHSPTAEQVALRAYEIYLARGGIPGNDLEDWLQAEQELRFPSPRS